MSSSLYKGGELIYACPWKLTGSAGFQNVLWNLSGFAGKLINGWNLGLQRPLAEFSPAPIPLF